MKYLLIAFVFLTMRSFCQLPIELKNSACDRSMQSFVDLTRDHLKSVAIEKQELTINMGLIENCDFRFIFNARKTIDADTLYIEYGYEPIIDKDSTTGVILSSKTVAMCDCYFNIELIIDSIETIPSVILLGKSDSHEFTETVYQFNQLFLMEKNGLPIIPETFKKNSRKYNQIDANGNKIGIWKSKTNKFTVYTKYIESISLTTEKTWSVAFNIDKELKYFVIYTKNNQYQLDNKEQKLLKEKLNRLEIFSESKK